MSTAARAVRTSPAARRTILDAAALGRVIRDASGLDWRYAGARPGEGGDRYIVAKATIAALVGEDLIRLGAHGRWHLTAAGEAEQDQARKGSRTSTQDAPVGHTEPHTSVLDGWTVVVLDGIPCCVWCLERAGDCRLSGGTGPCEGSDAHAAAAADLAHTPEIGAWNV